MLTSLVYCCFAVSSGDVDPKLDEKAAIALLVSNGSRLGWK